MEKLVVALGLILLIVGVVLISGSAIPVSKWSTIFVENPKSELVLNKTFEVPASSFTTNIVYLAQGDNVTMNGAITAVGSSRSVSKELDFSVKADSETVLSYYRTENVTLSWTAPRSANYSLVFDNSFDSEPKDVIIMVMKYWRQTDEYTVLQNTPLVPPGFLWIGIVVCLFGGGLTAFGVLKKAAAS